MVLMVVPFYVIKWCCLWLPWLIIKCKYFVLFTNYLLCEKLFCFPRVILIHYSSFSNEYTFFFWHTNMENQNRQQTVENIYMFPLKTSKYSIKGKLGDIIYIVGWVAKFQAWVWMSCSSLTINPMRQPTGA